MPTQRDEWLQQIAILKTALQGLRGAIAFEFSIPRMGRRIDVLLLIEAVVFVIEFKAVAVDRYAMDQVWDYALDLKNFHEASHDRAIVPILVPTEAQLSTVRSPVMDVDRVYRPVTVGKNGLRTFIEQILACSADVPIDAQAWFFASYRPTPTIIEAARALYAQHSVDEIARHDAGAENLRVTSGHLQDIIEDAQRLKRKVICFVTGVPGAGKTLVGLNVATQEQGDGAIAPAVYLSGNDPLVAVLREALARDEVERQAVLGKTLRKGIAREKVKAFIQNVHHYRDDVIADSRPPVEHVAIFDEAQRAWTHRKTETFMRTRKKIAGFSQSEPEFLISSLDRHADWAVIVCLVGGGQEINEGEAGIDAWLDAISAQFPGWRMHISSRLTDNEYAAGRALDRVRNRPETFLDECLHLAVSMRSFRAEHVSSFVKAVLELDESCARETLAQFLSRYPISVTRDLALAKEWIRTRARGSERFGMLASSKALRLRPHAIDVRISVDPVHWFLDDRDDTRSSYYLEEAATEFQVQGLELDWTCVTWDGDLRFGSSGWGYHDFVGSRWINVNSVVNRRYLLNAYRVLLTRARQGMVIFIPPGDRHDKTREPAFYDSTYRYLRDVGVPEATI